ncbi:MAG: AbrB/MazE/SpoVT family DNA-binding domain-containing protein [Salinibacterium sp.]|nr:MAG: AbrB/MazE/SpoVT family DNA-binding domain-containing protein [Salinibacterium sp.]
MSTATVTSKGQVTIPIDVRQKLGIHPGTKVEFIESAGGSYEFVAATGSIRDIRGMFTWSGPPVTLEEMDDAIAAAAAETLRS